MNGFFEQLNLQKITCPTEDTFPVDFTFPRGSDSGLEAQERRSIRFPFLEKMYKYGYLCTLPPLQNILLKDQNVWFFF